MKRRWKRRNVQAERHLNPDRNVKKISEIIGIHKTPEKRVSIQQSWAHETTVATF